MGSDLLVGAVAAHVWSALQLLEEPVSTETGQADTEPSKHSGVKINGLWRGRHPALHRLPFGAPDLWRYSGGAVVSGQPAGLT